MASIFTARVNKPLHLTVVSSFLHGKIDHEIDLANILGLIQLSSS